MTTLRNGVFLLLILLYAVKIAAANSTFHSQNENPIENFSLNEDDTTRYTHHYLYEQAYLLIEDMLVGKRAISLKDAEFAIENAFLERQSFQERQLLFHK